MKVCIFFWKEKNFCKNLEKMGKVCTKGEVEK